MKRWQRTAVWLALLAACAWSFGANKALARRVADLESRAIYYRGETKP